MIQQEPNLSPCDNSRSRSACTRQTWQRSWQQEMHIVLVTIQQLARSVKRRCSAVVNENERHARHWLCDFRDLSTGACGVVVAVNEHRMDFLLAHSIVKLFYHLKQNNAMKNVHSFRVNSHKCKADGSLLCQYYYTPTTSKLFSYFISCRKSIPKIAKRYVNEKGLCGTAFIKLNDAFVAASNLLEQLTFSRLLLHGNNDFCNSHVCYSKYSKYS